MRSWGLGHADCADDADFFFALLCPTDCTDYTDLCPIRTGISQMVCYSVLIFLPLRLSCKESSTFSPSPSSSGSGDVTALCAVFSKITPSLFTIIEGSTSHPGPLTLRGEGGNRPQCYICPTCPSPAGGSLILNQAFPLTIKRKDVTALRCSEPLRSKVGGPSKVSPDCAGWDRRGTD